MGSDPLQCECLCCDTDGFIVAHGVDRKRKTTAYSFKEKLSAVVTVGAEGNQQQAPMAFYDSSRVYMSVRMVAGSTAWEGSEI